MGPVPSAMQQSTKKYFQGLVPESRPREQHKNPPGNNFAVDCSIAQLLAALGMALALGTAFGLDQK